MKPVPKWTNLHGLGESRVVRSSWVWLAIVPTAARVLSGAGGEKELQVLGSQFTVSLALPFTWQVLYLSALCFASAGLVYVLCCPTFIRHYPRFSMFGIDGGGVLVLEGALSDMMRIDSDVYAGHVEEIEAALNSARNLQNKDALSRAFALVREAMDLTRSRTRALCSTLYALGIIQLVWIVLENVNDVLGHQ